MKIPLDLNIFLSKYQNVGCSVTLGNLEGGEGDFRIELFYNQRKYFSIILPIPNLRMPYWVAFARIKEFFIKPYFLSNSTLLHISPFQVPNF